MQTNQSKFERLIEALNEALPDDLSQVSDVLQKLQKQHQKEITKGNFAVARAYYELNNPKALEQIQLVASDENENHTLALEIAIYARFATHEDFLKKLENYVPNEMAWCLTRSLGDLPTKAHREDVANLICGQVNDDNLNDWLSSLSVLCEFGFGSKVSALNVLSLRDDKIPEKLMPIYASVFWHSDQLYENASFFERAYKTKNLPPDTSWIVSKACQKLKIITQYDFSQSETEGRYTDQLLHAFFSKQKTFGYQPNDLNFGALVGHNLAAGGAEKILASTFSELSGSNHKVQLWLHSLEAVQSHDFFFNKFNLQRHGTSITVMKQQEPNQTPFMFLDSYVGSEAFTVYKEIIEKRPKFIHAWQDTTNIEVALAAIQAGVNKIFLHPHNLRPTRVHKIPLTISMKTAYRALSQRSEVFFIFPATAAQKDYADWMGIDLQENSAVIPNGFDFQTKHNSNICLLRHELGLRKPCKIVVGAFRLTEIKQPDLWLEVAFKCSRHDPDLHFVLLGDGEETARLKAKIKKSGLENRIHLLGRRQNVEELISTADVFLQTSRSEYLPSSIIEALGVGIPVVATDVGGTRECLAPGGDKSFLNLAKSGDEKKLTDLVLQCTKTTFSTAQKADIKSKTVAHFSSKTMARRLVGLYEDFNLLN